MRSTSGLGRHPRPHLPGRRVADVLGMAARELGDPLPLGILVESDDATIRDHSVIIELAALGSAHWCPRILGPESFVDDGAHSFSNRCTT